MNKEEILAKSKKENILGDEREKEVRIRRDAFSFWGLIFLGIIIMLIKLIRVQSPADIISLMFCTSGLGFIYEGVKLKSKWNTILGIIFLILAGYFLYKFCVGLF
jgi:hypothetical protein